MSKREKMIGRKVGNSTVVAVEEAARMPSGNFRYTYRLLCACGNEFTLSRNAIGGAAEPCVICRAKNAPEKTTEHPLYKTWQSMHARCYQPSCDSYKIYGARGVTVCTEWSGRGGFLTFIRDVGERPTPTHSLDRINNDIGYTSSNVRWATPLEQAQNRATTKLVTIGGKTQSFSVWLRELGIASSVAFRRMKKDNINHAQFIQTAMLRKD